jgi:hypothetical protein
MRSSAALLSALVVVGNAQTATFRSKDFFGNTLSETTTDYTPGEKFMATIDLGVSNWELKELELETGSYGLNQCTFMMKPQGKNKKEKKQMPVPVGMFKDNCDWPNVIVESKQTTYKLNVENIWQFYSDVHLYLECDTMDVTLSRATSDIGCTLGKDDTAQNNQLENIYTAFNFEDVLWTEKAWMMDLVAVYVFNFADIFLGGLNPLSDLIIKAGNYCVYEKNMVRMMQAAGWIPLHENMLMGSKHEKAPTQEDMDMYVEHFIMFGEGIYGSEVLFAAYPFLDTFKDEGLSGVNDMIFKTLNYDDTKFYETIQGDLSFDSDFYQNVGFYFYLHAAIMETMVGIYMATTNLWELLYQFPRIFAAHWDLAHSMLE